mmetsp:Transcript_2125/g.5328  ORF Transcript_2125/g.5328 Transcript_2125/m.5328 type:complete len:205 (+) Transcript_2125:762-1376(+)
MPRTRCPRCGPLVSQRSGSRPHLPARPPTPSPSCPCCQWPAIHHRDSTPRSRSLQCGRPARWRNASRLLLRVPPPTFAPCRPKCWWPASSCPGSTPRKRRRRRRSHQCGPPRYRRSASRLLLPAPLPTPSPSCPSCLWSASGHPGSKPRRLCGWCDPAAPPPRRHARCLPSLPCNALGRSRSSAFRRHPQPETTPREGHMHEGP